MAENAWEKLKEVIPGPLGAMLLAGGLAYGGGRLLWSPIVETSRTLFRYPGRKLTGISDEEWNARMDELRDSEEWKHKIPLWGAALSALGIAALSYRPNERYNGLGTKFDELPKAYTPSSTSVTNQTRMSVPEVAKEAYGTGMNVTASLTKQADFNPYLSNINFGNQINSNAAIGLFNDPLLRQNDPYAANMGTSIIANAAMNQGTRDITLGSVFDSAMDKFDNKLSFGGIAEIGTRSLVSNCLSRMFTGALDTMVGLSPTTRQNLIDTGTWAGAISAIID